MLTHWSKVFLCDSQLPRTLKKINQILDLNQVERQQLDKNKTGQIQLCSTFVQSSTPELRHSVKLPSISPEHIKYLFCGQHKGNKYSTPSMEATLA